MQAFRPLSIFFFKPLLMSLRPQVFFYTQLQEHAEGTAVYLVIC